MNKAAITPEAEVEAAGAEAASDEQLGAFSDFVDSLDFEDLDKDKDDEE